MTGRMDEDLCKRIDKIIGKNFQNKKIVFLGVTFKPNTDDMRDSTSLAMIPYLSRKGAKIFYYDPSGPKENFKKIKNCKFINNISENCKTADLIILHTDWDEFKSLDFKKIAKKKNFKLYDLRNLYNFDERYIWNIFQKVQILRIVKYCQLFIVNYSLGS